MGITTITATVEIMDTEDSIKDTAEATDSVEALTKDYINWTNATYSWQAEKLLYIPQRDFHEINLLFIRTISSFVNKIRTFLILEG